MAKLHAAADLESLRGKMTADEFVERHGPGYLYHFTDVENLPSIRQHGLYAHAELVRRGLLPIKPGGNDWSHEADAYKGVDGYVHLCLVDHDHPMEYRAREDGRIGETRYLKVSMEVLFQEGVLGCQTVANRADAEVLPLERALDQMDLDILYRGFVDFSNLELRNRHNAAKKSEILIPKHIPIEQIRNLR